MRDALFGVMQGRLIPPVQGRIQAFPTVSWEKEFYIAQQLGLECIEFIFDGNVAEHPLMNGQGLERITSLIKETQVRVITVCADYFMSNPLHQLQVRDSSVLILNKLIENCAKVDISIIVIPCVDESRLISSESKSLFVDSIKRCTQVCEQFGVALALETDLPPLEFKELLEAFNSKYIGVNYDIGNSASLGYDPVEEILAYGDRIKDVHIKDRAYRGTTVPLGTGHVDFPLVIGEIIKSGYEGPYILQAARQVLGQEEKTILDYINFSKNIFIGK